MYRSRNDKGIALVATFIIVITLTVIVLAFMTMIIFEVKNTGVVMQNMQAFYIAEAGRAKARWALTTGEEAAGWGESDISFAGGTYTVTTTDNGDDTVTIQSDGYIPDDTDPIAQRRVIEKNVPLTSTNFSLAATATASSTQGGNTPDKSNDGNSSSKWRSSIHNGSWLKHDFGSSTTFDRIVYTGSKIDSYDIKYSTDDSVYNSVSGAVESPAGTVNFNSVTARYLRFDANGNKPSVNELETYNSAEGGLDQGTFVTSW